MTEENNVLDQLQQIGIEIKACQQCLLHQTRTQAVPGDGEARRPLMFIGEAPGGEEDKQGLPFVGASGKFLSSLLEKNGIARQDIYITNVIKCRPPNNRDPLPEEINNCKPFLRKQFAIIHPKVVVTLGRYSMSLFLPDHRISKVHGELFRVKSTYVIPMYHPAAALYNPKLRPEMEKDFAGMAYFLSTLEEKEGGEDDEGHPLA